ncbi:putative membrane protein [Pseudarthrobacter niigatensis]|uniref:Membrane protein n=1 Tax=Pseudarthrobacter niigatensis TaxID=369935 RepID=A0AAJ1SUT7_9MICC|nr:putative membrane protein [Pseudarthrobacter niigatensis]MDQ0267659.1 putative membrane protein [Pseudarthrobacter niigatensis]
MNAPVRPQQRPSAPTGAPGQRPAVPGQRPQQGDRPAQPGQRPFQGQPGQRPAQTGQRPAQGASGQGTPGLVKPAPKAKVRRARLLISKVDPWSVLKMAFLLSVALGIVTVVAAIVLWTVLDLTGIFDQVDSLLGTLAGAESGGFELKKVASLGQVASFATIIAVVNVVLLTALSMLSAVLYNISATLVGGIGVTLTDD